jgi:hypothetical protein
MTTDGQAPTDNPDRKALWDSLFRTAQLMDEAGAKNADVTLLPGERRAANGVIIGSGAALDIARFGADETDNDYPAEG